MPITMSATSAEHQQTFRARRRQEVSEKRCIFSLQSIGVSESVCGRPHTEA
jgi:hypothetical protein